jgi:hypothetical protein
MPEFFDHENEQRSFLPYYLGGWRVVASAWAIVIAAVLLFGVEALASRHMTLPQDQQLVGAVIPQHDPNCAGPGVITPSPKCHAVVGDILERAGADAEAAAAYGL